MNKKLWWYFAILVILILLSISPIGDFMFDIFRMGTDIISEKASKKIERIWDSLYFIEDKKD